jgi:SPP1 family predicted phage head-tail adaptor
MSDIPGKLDQRITFQEESRNDDGGGGVIREWINVSVNPTVWASVRAKSGRESLATDRIDAEAGYVFKIRNRADLTEKNIILWNGRKFNITFVQAVSGRPLYLEIEADQGVAI